MIVTAPAPVPAQKAETAPPTRLVAACDLGERLIVLGLYLGLVARLVAAWWEPSSAEKGSLANLLLLPSEGLVVIFLLLRRSTGRISLRWQDWLLALLATLSPMLVRPGVEAALVPPVVGATLLVMGTVVQVHAKLTLGRSFGCVPAHRGLQLGGPYRFVRHPMYAGYLLGHIAFLLMNPKVWNIAAYAVCYALQIPRLLAEERLLANDGQYRAYQETVKYRMIPGIF
jgi:protein-S-isoprenylcysteine O-methyltransferase Ste14